MLKYQKERNSLSLKQIFPIHSNSFLNSVFYLVSPFIVLFVSIYKLVISLLQISSYTSHDFCGKRLFVNNNTCFYSRTAEQLNQDDIILSFQTPLEVDGFHNIKITKLVSMGNAMRAFKLAVESLWRLNIGYDYSACIYALNAFDCYLLMIALDNLSTDVVLITDAQIDRLACILDSAKQTNKETIMHGSLFVHGEPLDILRPYVIYNSEEIEWCYDMPVRLVNICKIYSFSQKEGNYLKISTMTPDSTPLIVNVGYGTKFSEIPKSIDRLDILLVANDTMLVYENKMCHLFFQNGYNVLIQVHPLSDISKYKFIVNQGIAKIIEYNQRNPLVDLVVSYGSTLAHEYEAINIPVVYYTDYIENNNLKEIELIKAVNKYGK